MVTRPISRVLPRRNADRTGPPCVHRLYDSWCFTASFLTVNYSSTGSQREKNRQLRPSVILFRANPIPFPSPTFENIFALNLLRLSFAESLMTERVFVKRLKIFLSRMYFSPVQIVSRLNVLTFFIK